MSTEDIKRIFERQNKYTDISKECYKSYSILCANRVEEIQSDNSVKELLEINEILVAEFCILIKWYYNHLIITNIRDRVLAEKIIEDFWDIDLVLSEVTRWNRKKFVRENGRRFSIYLKAFDKPQRFEKLTEDFLYLIDSYSNSNYRFNKSVNNFFSMRFENIYIIVEEFVKVIIKKYL